MLPALLLFIALFLGRRGIQDIKLDHPIILLRKIRVMTKTKSVGWKNTLSLQYWHDMLNVFSSSTATIGI